MKPTSHTGELEDKCSLGPNFQVFVSCIESCTRLGHLLLGLVLVQADGEPEHNFLYICTNVMSFELFDGRNNYFECIADER